PAERTMSRKPKLGQHFLVDDSARQHIADALGDVSQRTVIEIGPGHGAITSVLAPRCRRLIAIELDPALAAELRAAGRPPWQVLAGAARDGRYAGEILADEAPYGVGYLVASWARS
ncbi:MAG: rRNA adenine N-6-methyltransferase family protein, partial [Actinoallomurus sp.]